jgi:hypothetical protein
MCGSETEVLALHACNPPRNGKVEQDFADACSYNLVVQVQVAGEEGGLCVNAMGRAEKIKNSEAHAC